MRSASSCSSRVGRTSSDRPGPGAERGDRAPPDAILIAPTDKQQLVGPLQQAVDAGIEVITVRHLH